MAPDRRSLAALCGIAVFAATALGAAGQSPPPDTGELPLAPDTLARQLLVQYMEAEGFQNYEQEWWHFSFDLPDALPFDLPIS